MASVRNSEVPAPEVQKEVARRCVLRDEIAPCDALIGFAPSLLRRIRAVQSAMSAAAAPRVFTVYAALSLTAAMGGCLLLIALVPEDQGSAADLMAVLPGAVGVTALLGILHRKVDRSSISVADLITLARASLIAVVLGWAVLVALGSLAPASWLLLGITTLALLLDGVDGAVARRWDRATPVGAVLDAETDAVMMVALSVLAAYQVGPWIVLAGALRYLFGLTWRMRWSAVVPLGHPLPDRPLRRVIAALSAGSLAAATAPILPGALVFGLCAVSLTLLLVSFGLDGIWLEVAIRRGVVGDVVGRSALQGRIDPTDVFAEDPQAQQLHRTDGGDDDDR